MCIRDRPQAIHVGPYFPEAELQVFLVRVDEDTAGDYDYKSSIATQTYDKIKLSRCV